MTKGIGIKKRGVMVSLMILGGGMSACAMGGKANWEEEVLLHDGRKIVVERSLSRRGRHEPFKRPAIGDQSLSFTMPGSHQRVTWKDAYSKDIASANFNLMMLDVDKGTAYLVASPMGCLSYNKWGRPNPPYVVFRYRDKDWQRIPLQELPAGFEKPNLIISSPDDAVKRAGQGLISAEKVKELNTGFQQPEYRTIVREPLKPGSAGVSCPELLYYKGGWISPGNSIGRRMMDRMSQ